MTNKNSLYIQALVGFIRDTKPYHSKLTSITEVYQFSEEMTVNFSERTFNQIMSKAAWPYTYFSSGSTNTVIPPLPVHRIATPLFRNLTKNNEPSSNRGSFKVNRDENTDLPLLPYAYDPKSIQGVGLADAILQRGGNPLRAEALVEGHDVFLSHGAYVFQIKQTVNSQRRVQGRFYKAYETEADGPYPVTVNLDFLADELVLTGPVIKIDEDTVQVTGPGIVKVVGLSAGVNVDPTFTEKRNEDLITAVTGQAQVVALDRTNPKSSINQIIALLNEFRALNVSDDQAVDEALDELFAFVNATPPVLPRSYEGLINAATTAGLDFPGGFTTWEDVQKEFSALSPSLYFNSYTDVGLRESGRLIYSDVVGPLTITNITADDQRADYEEYTIRAESTVNYLVRGSASGTIGTFTIPAVDTPVQFNSQQVDFTIERDSTVGAGYVASLTPASKITVHHAAPLEGWSLVKVNPIAYTRPLFSSTRYGYLQSNQGVLNKIEVLDSSFPTSTITLEATATNKFTISSTADSSYSAEATVNVPFNDGKLAFTIKQGTALPFEIGDKFTIEIQNNPASGVDADLYFGYDMGPYDANEIVYNTVNSAVQDYLSTLDFKYDSRFDNYDLASFNLSVSQSAVDGRQWRLQAIPNLSRPLLLQSSSPTNVLNQKATDDPYNPNAVAQFDLPNDVTSEGPQSGSDPDDQSDIFVYYADQFSLEYLDVGGTWEQVATVPVGSAYTSATHGLSFNLVPASKPFIGTRVKSSFIEQIGGQPVTHTVDGGDVITFTVKNEGPFQVGLAGLTSARSPRLVMHGDSYHNTRAGNWVLTFVSPQLYTLQGTYTSGALNGTAAFQSTVSVDLISDGYSYRNDEIGLHFTVKPGRGLGVGDKFTFTTTVERPSYLVHGTLSGWQPPAQVGSWYWNGKIGFKIDAPSLELFYNGDSLSGFENSWGLADPIPTEGELNVTRIRFDCPTTSYTIRAHNDGHWMLYREGKLISDGATKLEDDYVTIELPPAVAGTSLVLKVSGDDHALALGNDLAIINTSPGRMPKAGDFVVFSRTESDDVMLSIRAVDSDHQLALNELAPANVDIRFVDHYTNSEIPLSATSPEVDILQGWIPATKKFFDTATSTSNFSDTAERLVITAAATGETIGRIDPIGSDLNQVLFRWDEDFHAKYLPLNSEATMLALGSGMDDRLVVNMTEGIHFLISGGGLVEDSLFSDSVSVSLTDSSLMKIKSSYENSFSVTLSDGPFTGFLPGYDNLPYDNELFNSDLDGTVGGAYDLGPGLTEYYEVAAHLSTISDRTAEEERRYQDALGLVNNYLINGSIEQTSLEQFLAAVDADPYKGTIQNYGFGIPDVGAGIQIEDRPSVTASTSIVEAMVMSSNDLGYPLDQFALDVGKLDAFSDTTTLSFSTEPLPLPSSGLPAGGTLYQDFVTPFHFELPSRSFELSFSYNMNFPPTIYVWRPTDAAPQLVPLVEKISAKKYRFSIPAASEVKLVLA